MGGVFDLGTQHIKAVNFSRQNRGNRGNGFIAAIGDFLGTASCIGTDHRIDTEFLAQFAALAKGVHVAMDFLDVFDLCARYGDQRMVNAQEGFTDNMHARFRQDVVHVGDTPGQGVVNRDHRQFDFAFFQCTKGAFKGPVGYCRCTRKGATGCLI